MAFAEGKLGKLTIIFYPVSKLPGVGIPYTPMYNPTSFSVNHTVNYNQKKQPTVSDMTKEFLSSNPRSVSMELFFDGTGASPSASKGLGFNSAIKSVDLQIQAFLKLAYQISGTIHQPSYMMLVWGTFVMTGVLKTANVTYTMFAADGRPLRAKMAITVEEHIDATLLFKALKLESPDVSKSIIVKEGDTLPLLCFKEYSDSSLYIKVAEVNNLKNYRKLKQGMELLFPPIDNLV
jgi:nucleoid-associated protein YgaU